MLFGLLSFSKQDKKGKGIDPAERPQPQPDPKSRRVGSDAGLVSMLSRERDRDRERHRVIRPSRSHTALNEKWRSIFGRLWHADSPSRRERLEPVPLPSPPGLTAGPSGTSCWPENDEKPILASLKDAAGSHLPVVSEESESPSPTLPPARLIDLAQMLSEAPSRPCSGVPCPPSPPHPPSPSLRLVPTLEPQPQHRPNPAPEPQSELRQSECADDRAEPATPPATPMVADTPGPTPATVAQLAPVLEMDQALALAQAHLFDDEPSSSTASPSSSSPSQSAPASRAEPATPPAMPMTAASPRLSLTSSPLGTVVERDFAYGTRPLVHFDTERTETGERSEPPTPPATPMSPCSTAPGRLRHASQLATVLEVEHALILAQTRGDRVKLEPTTPPATPMVARGGSRRWRLSMAPGGIPPVLEWDQKEGAEGEAEETRAITSSSAPAKEVKVVAADVAAAMAETIAPVPAAIPRTTTPDRAPGNPAPKARAAAAVVDDSGSSADSDWDAKVPRVLAIAPAPAPSKGRRRLSKSKGSGASAAG